MIDWSVEKNDEQTQRQLLAECTPDLKKAMKIATSTETVIKNAKDLTRRTAGESDTINRVGDKPRRDQRRTGTADCVMGVDITSNKANLRMPSVLCVTRKDTLQASVKAGHNGMVKVDIKKRRQFDIRGSVFARPW